LEEGRFFEDEVDKLDLKADVLEILLKMVFNLPAEDCLGTIRSVLNHWRGEMKEGVKLETGSDLVRKLWENYDLIQNAEETEHVAKIERRILLVKLYLDYQRLKREIAAKNIKVESNSRKVDGKALVCSEIKELT
jgi:hypothetical protein